MLTNDTRAGRRAGTNRPGAAPAGAAATAARTARMRAHVLETGRLTANATFLRGTEFSALLRRRRECEFPVQSYVLEHPEGLIVIDTGLKPPVRVPHVQRRFCPVPVPGSARDIADGMRALGFAPGDVRRVVLTHLDWDHTGNLDAFPHADVLVHRPEHAFAETWGGRQRYQPRRWPSSFRPTLYDLRPEPCGPFPASLPLTEAGDVRIVPLPGHSAGHVGVLARTEGPALLFAGDHMLRQDWFVEDCQAGRLVALGIWFRAQAIETSRRVRALAASVPTVLLPAHDAAAPARLAALEPLPT